MSLQEKLKEYSTNKAKELKILPYRVYSNKVLNDISILSPQTTEELLDIDGIGKKKATDYGEDILQLCSGIKATIIEESPKPFTPNELPNDINLSDEQQKVISLCDEGNNVFMTGPGGTGKSFLIKLLVERYKGVKKVQVCALTGVAAELLGLGAKTIHSWSGTGLSRGDKERILNGIKKNRKNMSDWKKIDILIVDEVSMMSRKYYDILDFIGRSIRIKHKEKPFGGIQLIFCGDFYQLPPVLDENDPQTGEFCFESPSWKMTFENVVVLQTIFRQKDPLFTKILKQIRNGKISRKTLAILQEKLVDEKTISENRLDSTIISPLRSVVKRINDENMDKLDTEEQSYQYTVIIPENHKPSEKYINYEVCQLRKQMVSDETLHLKKGSRVMCIANIDMHGIDPIVNGSQGIIEDFERGVPVVQFKNGVKRIMDYHSWKSDVIPGLEIQQIPLILSWAITIHKSQGITLDSAIIDAGNNIFEYGQTYVAFSRLTTLDGLYLKEFNYRKITTNPKVITYYSSL